MYSRHWSLDVLFSVLFQSILHPLWVLGQYLIRRIPKSANGANVYNIVFRNNFDPISLENKQSYFMLSYQEHRAADCILNDNVSLFYLDSKEAVFIEVEDGVKLWQSQHGAFYKIAQYRCAKRVIILPLREFIEVVDNLPDPGERLNFVHFLMRSGSTLLMQIFEATGKCITYSEPDEFGRTFSRFKGPLSDKEQVTIWRAVGKFMCKYDSNNNEGVKYIAKIPGDFLVGKIDLFCKAFPHSKHILLYRDLHPYLYSATTAISQLPFMCVVDTFLGSNSWLRRFVMLHLLVRIHSEVLGDTSLIEKNLWSCKEGQIFQFVYIRNVILKYFSGRSNFPAVKYEDILANQQDNIGRIFEYFGIDTKLVPKALLALQKDSQAHTPLARQRRRSTQYEHLRNIAGMPRGLKEDVFDLCQVMGVSSLEDNQRMPGTITTP